MYHIGLALTAEQVKQFKSLALSRDLTVKDLATKLVVDAINKYMGIPVKPSISDKK